MNVMIIDDSKTMRMIIGRTIKELGHTIVEAGNGKEGIEQIHKASQVDLVMVDWNMPEMNGLEFVVALRSEERYRTLPVMMVTTETEMENITKAMAAGANEYIMKPFTKETVLEKITILGLAGATP
jgi:two-component system chemotaxis response regulator CheY